MLPYRLIFLGTPDFAVPTLQALLNRTDLVNVVAVYTQPDRPAGRGQKATKPAVKIFAQEAEIAVFQPADINLVEEKRRFSDLMPDVAVVVAYAQFLSPAILNTPRLGCINVHASLLPKYRGASPIQAAILNDDKETGVTTIKLVPKMDAGPILHRRVVPIANQTTAFELSKELSKAGAEVLIETIEKIGNRKIQEQDQDESQVSYAREIKKEDGLINWNKTGRQISCQIRAFTPWPGSYMETSLGRIKVHAVKFHEHIKGVPEELKPAEVYLGSGSFLVRCLNGWLELLILQPEGKKPMSTKDFLNGTRTPSEFKIK